MAAYYGLEDAVTVLIVVGEHQFTYGDGVVLIDNRNDAVLQHYGHTVFLVEVMAAGGKVLFHCEHLSHGDAMLPEQLVVAVDEFGLPYSGKELALVYAVQLLGGAHFTTSRSNGSGRNKYYFYAGLVQLGYLVHQSGHAGDVESAVTTC